MFVQSLQRLSAAVFSALRRGQERCGKWVHARPWLEAWFYRECGVDAAYREFNLWYFSQFSQQEKMLSDGPRMAFYHAAIAQSIKPGDRVIDLGTGTGVLAAFASRQGAAKVYALDHSGILKHARRLASHNGIKNVDFITTHSRDFKLKDRVDVILHEQMGDYLFDEAMVANVIDLRDRVLKPDGRIVPARFEFFCEPIKVRDERRIPFIWELNAHGFDCSCLERSRPQDPEYYSHASSDLGVVEHFLGRPEAALTVDLQTINMADLPPMIRVKRTVVNAGRLDGFVVFFRARADEDLTLSTSPLEAGRAPHWGYRILRAEAGSFAAGEVIDLELTVGQWAEPHTWRWRQVRGG